MTRDLELPFEFYKPCSGCDGYGSLNLMMTHFTDAETAHYKKRLKQDTVYYGNNICNACNATGFVVDYELEDLELDI